MLDSPIPRLRVPTRLLLLESPYSKHLHADLRWPFRGGGWRSLEDAEHNRCRNRKNMFFYEIRKISCVTGYVFSYILISLHKSTFFLKIQVC